MSNLETCYYVKLGGFEPPTSYVQGRRADQLPYSLWGDLRITISPLQLHKLMCFLYTKTTALSAGIEPT